MVALHDQYVNAYHEAYDILKDKVRCTPVIQSETVNRLVNSTSDSDDVVSSDLDLQVSFKCENLQTTGSFKFRGATHFISKLSDEELRRGVVAYSTGNHAQAVACATRVISNTRDISIPCTVIMPKTAPAVKVQSAKRFGATVVQHGTSTADGVVLAEQLQREEGTTLIPPSGHREIMLGQATTMLEFYGQAIVETNEPLDLVVVPSAGGGLLAGTSLVCAGTNTLVVGVEPARGGACLSKSRQVGKRIPAIDQTYTTIADGLRSPTHDFNWQFVRDKDLVLDVLTATDEEIQKAMRIMIEELKMLVEPSAAVALAVILYNSKLKNIVRTRGIRNVGMVVSGGNTTMDKVFQVFQNVQ